MRLRLHVAQPAQGQRSVPYFHHIEAIFKRYQGRPHWGKMHTQTTGNLAALYPRWHDFRRIRAALDPQGIFLNDYLRRLFDADGPVPAHADAHSGAKDEESS
jgi:FAD/FMN-containing dehydrogenase